MNGTGGYTKRQKLIVVVIGIVNFCSAICVSLQAPFYPKEAEMKGATATGYGLVFGIFELTVFIVSPILGKHLYYIGVKRTLNVGIFTTGSCCIIFGLLDRISGAIPFISASVIVRALEAVGNSGFLTASFSIIASEFPDSVATMFSTQEMCFGFGLIVGPSIGAYLYDIGGYTLPFVCMGSILVSAAFMTCFMLPSFINNEESQEDSGIIRALQIPSISLAALSIIAASLGLGFLQASLEPHMRIFELSQMTISLMFVINGGTYAVTTLIWGRLCDTKLHPKTVSIIGCFLIIVAFSILGPAPYIPYKPLYYACIAALVIHGVGFSAMLVAGFTDAHKQAIINGFPDNINTYGLISGLWTSMFALGAFIGPTFGGILTDQFGFRWASLLVIASSSILMIMYLLYVIVTKIKISKIHPDYSHIPGDDEANLTQDRRQYGSFDSNFSKESGLTRSSTGYSSLGDGESASNGIGSNSSSGTESLKIKQHSSTLSEHKKRLKKSVKKMKQREVKIQAEIEYSSDDNPQIHQINQRPKKSIAKAAPDKILIL